MLNSPLEPFQSFLELIHSLCRLLCCMPLRRRGWALCLRSPCLCSRSISQTPNRWDKLHPFTSMCNIVHVWNSQVHIFPARTQNLSSVTSGQNGWIPSTIKESVCVTKLKCNQVLFFHFHFLLQMKSTKVQVWKQPHKPGQVIGLCYPQCSALMNRLMSDFLQKQIFFFNILDVILNKTWFD